MLRNNQIGRDRDHWTKGFYIYNKQYFLEIRVLVRLLSGEKTIPNRMSSISESVSYVLLEIYTYELLVFLWQYLRFQPQQTTEMRNIFVELNTKSQ
jgi:hypothetical protein